ncbi:MULTISPECIES: transposase family protein [Streptomyces violaceusniger group]|uniref:transposase family protein n=1 Tax=Streptomyces violaceusniger group TaxID=2839105 RepID=UPI00117BFF97|nr:MULTISPECIES: transposase family protein [Streptomyces violaceusniger group]
METRTEGVWAPGAARVYGIRAKAFSRQGRRYRLGTLPALYVLAVMAGARSLVTVCRFTAHLAPDLRTRLGLVGAVPALTTPSRR